jgi:ATP synthase I chain
MTAATSSLLAPATDAPEAEVARDLLRRMVWVAPLFVVAGAIGWGVDGALSSLVGLAICAANFAAAAALLGWGARTGPNALMLAVMGGYIVRLGAVLLVLWGLQDLAWVEMVPLGVTLVATHVGLLVWETKYVSLSLAFPGLKPGTDTEGPK